MSFFDMFWNQCAFCYLYHDPLGLRILHQEKIWIIHYTLLSSILAQFWNIFALKSLLSICFCSRSFAFRYAYVQLYLMLFFSGKVRADLKSKEEEETLFDQLPTI